MTVIRKSVLRSVRLDDDVWAALKGMEKSLNQFLRETILPAPEKTQKQVEPERQSAPVVIVDPVKRHVYKPHTLHSGARPIEGCEKCAALK